MTGGEVARGRATVLALAAGVVAVSVLVAVVVRPLVADPRWAALAGIAALTIGALAVRPRLGGWRDLGMRWRPERPALLAVPAIVALAPLAAGVRLPDATPLAVLVVGYLLTGFTEELIWRGMALRALRHGGPLAAVLTSSALFGVTHLVNLLYRDASPWLVLAQVWGAFCFGVGYAALRLRTGSIVPLMLLHALTDLVGALTAGPAIVFFVAQDVVLLALGLVLVLRRRAPRP